MKKHSLKIWLVLLGVFTAFLTISAVTATPASGAVETLDDPCVYEDSDSDYINPDFSVDLIMQKYHRNMNDMFNLYVKEMVKAEPDDPLGKVPEDLESCLIGDNFSTYCVAHNLLLNEKYGHMQYRKALNCKKYEFFDGAMERDAWSDYSDAFIYGEESEQQVEAIYQGQKVLAVSAKIEAIERELVDSKAALDQTLAAYEELKTAWPMHKKYMEIYESLIKYRDKLAEIRNHVEDFPGKFIDATTTQCT
ncbi:hypothetical protein ACFL2V_04200 [Pseudomonadota bacterium]